MSRETEHGAAAANATESVRGEEADALVREIAGHFLPGDERRTYVDGTTTLDMIREKVRAYVAAHPAVEDDPGCNHRMMRSPGGWDQDGDTEGCPGCGTRLVCVHDEAEGSWWEIAATPETTTEG